MKQLKLFFDLPDIDQVNEDFTLFCEFASRTFEHIDSFQAGALIVAGINDRFPELRNTYAAYNQLKSTWNDFNETVQRLYNEMYSPVIESKKAKNHGKGY